MTKRISVWLTLALIIFACAITFELTVVFGGAFSRYEPEVTLPAETTAVEEPEETREPTFEEKLIKTVTDKLDDVLSIYANYYVGDIDIDDVAEGAAEGAVAYIGDKYGNYHSAEEYESLMTTYSGEFAGIGVTITLNTDYYAVEILQVMNNSPALEAGLLPNDLIIEVEGESITSLGYETAINRIRGEVGTSVVLTVARGDDYSEIFDVTLTRRVVEQESVTCDFINTDGLFRPLAYIRILDFNQHSPEQFIDAMGTAIGEKSHGFVIDLRNNGGGTLNSVVEMLDALLPEGPIVRIQYKDGSEKVYESDENCFSEPIVVLVNGNTASAAELFVAALRDYGNAIVVGENTYGKGTVQTVIPLDDGSAVRVSTSMYLPPFSDNYEGVGISPDIEVSLADEYKNVNLFKLDYKNDAQLQAAMNLYK